MLFVTLFSYGFRNSIEHVIFCFILQFHFSVIVSISSEQRVINFAINVLVHNVYTRSVFVCRGLNAFLCFVILLIYYHSSDLFMFETVLINIYLKHSVSLADSKPWPLCELIYINWSSAVRKLSWESHANMYHKEEFSPKQYLCCHQQLAWVGNNRYFHRPGY